MASVFTDDFNRANNTALGANWNEARNDASINTNRMRLGVYTTLGASLVVTTTSAHAAIADCKVQVTQVSGSGDGGPVVRITNSGATPTYYAVDVYTGACETYRHDAAAAGTLLRTSSITQVANGVVALQASGTGATVTLKQFYQGTQRGADVLDTSANRITSATQTGIYNWATSATNCDYDDFSVDDLSAGTTAVGNTRVISWNILAAINNTRAANFNILALVNNSRALSFNILAATGNSRALSFDIKGAIGNSRAASWNIFSKVGNLRVATFDIYTVAGNTRAASWNIAAKTGNTRQILYDLSGPVGNSRQVLFDISGPVGNTRALTYNILTSAGNQRSALWNVLASVGVSRSASWQVLGLVGNNRVVLFNVLSNSVVVLRIKHPTSTRFLNSFSSTSIAPSHSVSAIAESATSTLSDDSQ